LGSISGYARFVDFVVTLVVAVILEPSASSLSLICDSDALGLEKLLAALFKELWLSCFS
jgi:hypothetical protein